MDAIGYGKLGDGQGNYYEVVGFWLFRNTEICEKIGKIELQELKKIAKNSIIGLKKYLNRWYLLYFTLVLLPTLRGFMPPLIIMQSGDYLCKNISCIYISFVKFC